MNRKLEKIDYKNMSDKEQKELYLRIKREEYFENNNRMVEGQEIVKKGVGIVSVVIVMVILVALYINFVAIPMK